MLYKPQRGENARFIEDKKKFAEKVSREDIDQGILELGIPEDEHISMVVGALQEIAPVLGF